MPEVQGLIRAKNESPTLVDFISNELIYLGYPIPGTDSNEQGWAICKFFKTGSVFRWHWVDGTKAKNYIWDSRADYDYAQNID